MKGSQNMLFLYPTLIAATAIVIGLSAAFYPEDVVLGNAIVPNIAAALAVATCITFFSGIIITLTKANFFQKATPLQTGIASGITNIIGFWIVGRFALYIGLGLSSVTVAVLLGVAITVVQFAFTYDWKKKTKKRR